MQAFEANFSTVVIRFFVMMFIVIAAGFIGQWWLALLSGPVFISAICAIGLKRPEKERSVAKVRQGGLRSIEKAA